MKKIINTRNAPGPVGAYSQAVLIENTLYISGQIGMIPDGDLEKNHRHSDEEQRQRVADAPISADQGGLEGMPVLAEDGRDCHHVVGVQGMFYTEG